MQNPKLAGFLRGAVFAVLGTLATYISSNLGSSGLVSTSVAGVIVGIVGIVEELITNSGAGAMFGMIK